MTIPAPMMHSEAAAEWGPREWRDFETFAHAMQRAPWRFAKTMPHMPHHYTLREHWLPQEQWSDDDLFAWCVQYIRSHGYRYKFGGRWYLQMDVNEHYYWSMGAPIPETILINRKRRLSRVPYDHISYKYDTLFRDDAAVAEEREVMRTLEVITGRPLQDQSVLDVGCGTGLLLQWATPRAYVGIDPSQGMLELLRHRWPDAAVVNTDLLRFAPTATLPRFDLIVALFGSASYLSDAELRRVPLLLAPGGVAVLMFYDPAHEPPFTYEATRTTVPHRYWDAAVLPGNDFMLSKYRVVVAR